MNISQLPDQWNLLEIVHLLCGGPRNAAVIAKEEEGQLAFLDDALTFGNLRAWRDGRCNQDGSFGMTFCHSKKYDSEIKIYRDDFLDFIDSIDKQFDKQHWPDCYHDIREQYLKTRFWDETTTERQPEDAKFGYTETSLPQKDLKASGKTSEMTPDDNNVDKQGTPQESE